MENTKVITSTDADFLLHFEDLDTNGFAFSYVKVEDGIYRYYVNCNNQIFGPFDEVSLSSCQNKAEWEAMRGGERLNYTEDGNECEIADPANDKSFITQEEIDDLLCAISIYDKKEDYNAVSHVLTVYPSQKRYFVTDKKKYGPYGYIWNAGYKDEEHFQFIYKKKKKSGVFYYNLNGKEIGPFKGGIGEIPLISVDSQNRNFLHLFRHQNFILVEGEKKKCFKKPHVNCSLHENGGHTIITGRDSNGNFGFIRDGFEVDFATNTVHDMPNGDVVYSRIGEDPQTHKETETWFYNDKQISVTVRGGSSRIYGTIISYVVKEEKTGTSKAAMLPFFMTNGIEYNGIPLEYSLKEHGFIFLENGQIKFFPWSVPVECKEFRPALEGNYLTLYYTNQLAGRD